MQRADTSPAFRVSCGQAQILSLLMMEKFLKNLPAHRHTEANLDAEQTLGTMAVAAGKQSTAAADGKCKNYSVFMNFGISELLQLRRTSQTSLAAGK